MRPGQSSVAAMTEFEGAEPSCKGGYSEKI